MKWGTYIGNDRYKFLRDLARGLRRLHASPGVMLPTLEAGNRLHCKPPIPDAELMEIYEEYKC